MSEIVFKKAFIYIFKKCQWLIIEYHDKNSNIIYFLLIIGSPNIPTTQIKLRVNHSRTLLFHEFKASAFQHESKKRNVLKKFTLLFATDVQKLAMNLECKDHPQYSAVSI